MTLLKSKRLWGLFLTVALLAYCFYDFDFDSVIKAISAINFWYLIPLIFLEAIIAFIRTARLKYIIDPCKKIGVRELYPYYCIGMMTNLLMPYLTGQVARIYLLSKRGQLKKTFLFTTTVLEVLFDGMALLGITIVISLFFVMPDEFKMWHLIVLTAAVLITVGLLIRVSHMKDMGEGVIDRFARRFPPALRRKIGDIKHSFYAGLETLKSSRHFTVVTLLSLLSWVAQASLVYILILAFRFDISLWGAVIITTVVTIMMLIVLSPFNIGTFQAATVAALGPFNIDKSPALAFSFMLHIAVYLPPIILGAFFSFKEGLTLRQLREEGEGPWLPSLNQRPRPQARLSSPVFSPGNCPEKHCKLLLMTVTSPKKLAARALAVDKLLAQTYGEKKQTRLTEPTAELILTVLSQNTNDINRDKAFETLRSRFPTWKILAAAKPVDIAKAIHIGGLSGIKSERIKKILNQIAERSPDFVLSFLEKMGDREVFDYLVSFDGVGPKTASCVLLFSLGRKAMPVDTHVHRVGGRLGFIPEGVDHDKAHQLFLDLNLPVDMYQFHLNLIQHGRALCRPTNPKCGPCPLKRYCLYYRAFVAGEK